MDFPIDDKLKEMLKERFSNLEKKLNGDLFTYYGFLGAFDVNLLRKIFEELAGAENRSEDLYIFLTTGGGSAESVQRMVNIIRHHYKKVHFIVPDYAYSAGTIFCMSGDSIMMDYVSVLGPIDPQVQDKEGMWVAALGYLDKINEIFEKSKKGTASPAEIHLICNMDLEKVRGYEQARDYAVDLLKKWLVEYKFANWNMHSGSDQPVTEKEKNDKAESIAAALSDNNKWKNHGRPINIKELKELGLKIDDYTNNSELKELICSYYDLMSEFIRLKQLGWFIQSRYLV